MTEEYTIACRARRLWWRYQAGTLQVLQEARSPTHPHGCSMARPGLQRGALGLHQVNRPGNDFRVELEKMLFTKELGRKPKSKEDGAIAQKLCADWLYAHGIIGLCWSHSSWPKYGEDKPVAKLNVAMFNGADVRIYKIERVEVEFKPKTKTNPDKLTCIEKQGAARLQMEL